VHLYIAAQRMATAYVQRRSRSSSVLINPTDSPRIPETWGNAWRESLAYHARRFRSPAKSLQPVNRTSGRSYIKTLPPILFVGGVAARHAAATMRFPSVVLLSLVGLAAATPQHRACQKTAFILAGDSTTAVQASNGGGWGTGFGLTVRWPSFSDNHAINGRSTKTFIENGDWDGVLTAVKEQRAAKDRVFVTIQFGHNDQKLVDFEETFRENLRRMVADVTDAGGTPVCCPLLQAK
jgi:hypothetical protein